jgi:hypothetical protein
MLSQQAEILQISKLTALPVERNGMVLKVPDPYRMNIASKTQKQLSSILRIHTNSQNRLH